MGIWAQIGLGTAFLSLASAVYLALLILGLPLFNKIDTALQRQYNNLRAGILICLSFAVVVLGHTIQVWVWAWAFLWAEAIPDVDTAVYFALTSYTTVGYGDITLGDSMRIFGTFSSICGMLAFGISTAFLAGVIGRVLPEGLRRGSTK